MSEIEKLLVEYPVKFNIGFFFPDHVNPRNGRG